MTTDEMVDALDGEIAQLRAARELLSSVQRMAKRGSAGEGGATLRAIIRQAEAVPKKRGMSAEGRARVAAAQRERWSKRNSSSRAAAKTDGTTVERAAKVSRKGSAAKASRGKATRSAPVKKIAPKRAAKAVSGAE